MSVPLEIYEIVKKLRDSVDSSASEVASELEDFIKHNENMDYSTYLVDVIELIGIVIKDTMIEMKKRGH